MNPIMSSQKPNPLPKKIVIVGGGIIGCTTAYLSHHPSYRSDIDEITILEASTTGVAQGASGKAGGLVAKWAYPRELVDVSSPEHVRLAGLHDGTERWGWRYVNCGNWKGRGGDNHSLASPGSGVGDGGDKTNLGKTAGLEDPNLERRGLPDDLHVHERNQLPHIFISWKFARSEEDPSRKVGDPGKRIVFFA